ncbi:PREDICTED: uncharacterized protein LOC109235254 [Nicotiana attenuata]|uniref:Uncharacterized protein n=1 Tax=Nicotiana attenuata TaxID=49451 RepID=A0A1J6IKV9_NICAT|nr:PREDICTED: uncharacterized protein LOC109235254 [Nicotiana attenuata]OIS95784.1 hypothetical protein A4A49_30785 [Nicotiana attenuata]
MDQLSSKKRVRDNSAELEINSPEVKRLREDLLDDLYDPSEFCSSSHDLDSFMKSFEDEITSPEPAMAGVWSESGESQPELGYLLEASDDELGLPPPTESETELSRVCTESAEIRNELLGFDGEIPGYDPFDLGIVESDQYSANVIGEYVVLDGLFDHSELGFGSGDFLWRPETLPAQ